MLWNTATADAPYRSKTQVPGGEEAVFGGWLYGRKGVGIARRLIHRGECWAPDESKEALCNTEGAAEMKVFASFVEMVLRTDMLAEPAMTAWLLNELASQLEVT
jgi:hypothetical protein